MNRLLDVDDFPLGTVVRTPSGRIGTVVKHHTESKLDYFQRVSVQFGKNPRDGVVLQPQFLTIVHKAPLQFDLFTPLAQVARRSR